jgi:hypothetical protein
MISKQTDEWLEQLETLGRGEGTELGEWWNILVEMRARTIDFGSPEFVAEYEKQVAKAFEQMLEWQEEELQYEPEDAPDPAVLQTATLASVKLALHDYHQALDRRQDANSASHRFVCECQSILNQHWKPKAAATLLETRKETE